MPNLDYFVVDVFTEIPLAGNPLADDLTMVAIQLH